MNNCFFSFFVIFNVYVACTSHLLFATGTKAVCLYPFIDLVGQPLKVDPETHSSFDAYANLTIAPHAESKLCLRVHQLLYNEIVSITEERADQVKINISNAWYSTEKSMTRQVEYWTHKSFLTPFPDLENAKIDSIIVPEPISFKENKNTLKSKTILTLALPFTDPHGRTFCAGTRFKKMAEKTNRKDGYEIVWYIEPETLQQQVLRIPKKYIYAHPEKETEMYNRAGLIKLLRSWCNTLSQPIQYVWGGGSIMQSHSTHHHLHKKSLWHQINPKSGIDCSFLVLRACQIVGIPYFFKNTRTALNNMGKITEATAILPGDLIYFPGHIMIVSDKTHVIEARGYAGGFGKLHELSINQVFENVNSIEEMFKKANLREPLQRLNAEGVPYETINELHILSLASVYANA